MATGIILTSTMLLSIPLFNKRKDMKTRLLKKNRRNVTIENNTVTVKNVDLVQNYGSESEAKTERNNRILFNARITPIYSIKRIKAFFKIK